GSLHHDALVPELEGLHQDTLGFCRIRGDRLGDQTIAHERFEPGPSLDQGPVGHVLAVDVQEIEVEGLQAARLHDFGSETACRLLEAGRPAALVENYRLAVEDD